MNLNLMEALQTQTTFFQVELRVLSFGCCGGRGGGAEGGGEVNSGIQFTTVLGGSSRICAIPASTRTRWANERSSIGKLTSLCFPTGQTFQ